MQALGDGGCHLAQPTAIGDDASGEWGCGWRIQHRTGSQAGGGDDVIAYVPKCCGYDDRTASFEPGKCAGGIPLGGRARPEC